MWRMCSFRMIITWPLEEGVIYLLFIEKYFKIHWHLPPIYAKKVTVYVFWTPDKLKFPHVIRHYHCSSQCQVHLGLLSKCQVYVHMVKFEHAFLCNLNFLISGECHGWSMLLNVKMQMNNMVNRGPLILESFSITADSN